MSVDVHIEYCGGWGYAPRYKELANLIRAKVPDANITGDTGRRTSFEVCVNKKEIFSKLKNMAFPDFEEVVTIVEEVHNGSEPREVTATQPGMSCAIL